MSMIDNKTVAKIAHLARIKLSDEQIPKYAQDLSNILQLVEQINQVDTDNIEPMAHPLDVSQRLRDDAVKETDQHQAFQKIAPATEAGLYLVPKVIE